MAPTHRIIIDTDPGVDDILAILLALAASPEEVEIVLLSICFGNTDVQNCLRNVVSMFHVLDKELEWRRKRNQLEGFGCMKTFRPTIAVGAEQPLEDQLLIADYFHGSDGLGGVHSTHPHLSPDKSWKTLFASPPGGLSVTQVGEPADITGPTAAFTASKQVAHKEILRILRGNEPDTITIVAIGPLTNLALAAAEDAKTFLRVKEVVVMGGAIHEEGNITPVAEFNVYADAVASARVYALTSPDPGSTLPPFPSPSTAVLPLVRASHGPYVDKLPRQLKLTLFPLDITTAHILYRSDFKAKTIPLVKAGSPLAEWTNALMDRVFAKMETLTHSGGERGGAVGLALHDPLCIWYILTSTSPAWMISPSGEEDIRVECAGQWTRGMCIVDRRMRKKATDGEVIIGDEAGWLNPRKGNRIRRMVASPGEEEFAHYLLGRIFG